MDEANDVNSNEVPNDVNDDEVLSSTKSLHRSTSKKLFGGVAGGISDRFDVDANIVRVVFVVLALVWGLGVAIYLAMWALIPRSPAGPLDEVEPEEELSHARAHWLRYALPLGVLVLIFLFFTVIHGGHHFGNGYQVVGLRFDKGLTLLWLVFLVVLAIVSLSTPARRLTIRRFFALAFLSFLSLLILVTGSFLLTLQVIGVPVSGGSGVKEWRPTTVAQLQHNYHGAFGESTINLLHVSFTTGTWSITATQGVGELTVEIPANVNVNLRTHVGIGTVQDERVRVLRDGRMLVAPSFATSTSTNGPNLNLNLQVGIGRIQLLRYSS